MNGATINIDMWRSPQAIQSCKIFFALFYRLYIASLLPAKTKETFFFALTLPCLESFTKLTKLPIPFEWIHNNFWWDAKVQLPKSEIIAVLCFPSVSLFFPMAWELKCRSCAHEARIVVKRKLKNLYSQKRILHYARFLFCYFCR